MSLCPPPSAQSSFIYSDRIGFSVANALYDIFVAYESPPANSNFGVRFVSQFKVFFGCPASTFDPRYRIYWKSAGSTRAEDDVPLEIIPSSYLHSADDVTGNNYFSSAGHASPKVVTTVEPGVTCSSFSFASGSAITLATAGSAATFTVTVKDSWDNMKTSTSFSNVVATIVERGSFASAAAATPNAIASSNTYTVVYTLTASSSYSISVLCNGQGILGSAFSLTVFPSVECGEDIVHAMFCCIDSNAN